ncbi:MAG: peptidoglycan synthetase [Marinilabiliaceae bacterium]|nr:peptidoglycan synthetase [Marinilabiliaceae bacterium]
MRVHFIAVGGSVMHNLALALHDKGYMVTGSDDEFFEPSKSRLEAAGILPNETGWHAERITADLDAVILGMHAMEDNPELERARELNLKIYSFPEYLYEQTANKRRVVVGGSHGKTTTTAMIMHALRFAGLKFDYMVGAQLEGFDRMVGLSHDAEIAVFEGDEYLTSTLDRRSKFLHYKPNVAIITGVAWDHVNVFPTWEGYVDQFRKFAASIVEYDSHSGSLIYCDTDEAATEASHSAPACANVIGYKGLHNETIGDRNIVILGDNRYEVGVFGRHNMQNMQAAMLACERVGVSNDTFMNSMKTFTGAAKRLQLINSNEKASAYLDFAHSPSKLEATTKAVRERYPSRKIVAIMELHTFSSLQKNFLSHYKGTMDAADKAYVFFNPEVVEHKRMEMFSPHDVAVAFAHPDMDVFTESSKLVEAIKANSYDNSVLLIMTSGNLNGVDIKKLATEVINK